MSCVVRSATESICVLFFKRKGTETQCQNSCMIVYLRVHTWHALHVSVVGARGVKWHTDICLPVQKTCSSVIPCINLSLMAPFLSEGTRHRMYSFQPKCIHEFCSNCTVGTEGRLEPFLCCVSSEPPWLRGGDTDGCSLSKACDCHLLHLSAFHFHTSLSAPH